MSGLGGSKPNWTVCGSNLNLTEEVSVTCHRKPNHQSRHHHAGKGWEIVWFDAAEGAS